VLLSSPDGEQDTTNYFQGFLIKLFGEIFLSENVEGMLSRECINECIAWNLPGENVLFILYSSRGTIMERQRRVG